MTPKLSFEVKGDSTQYLCDASTMEILCTGSDSNIIRLIGFSNRNEMHRHVHIQVEPVTRIFPYRILAHGNYSFLPQQVAPCF